MTLLQSETANPRYSYQPILESDTIRLLTLFPGRKGTTIHCELQEVNLSNNRTPYFALSYVWGDPSVTEGIRVHGKELQVTTNLESALQCLRLCDDSRILWIDAICIDQENLTERNGQIQHMVQIYSLASSVFVWLGNDDSIPHAFNIMKNLHQTCHKEEAKEKGEEPNDAPAVGMAHQSKPPPPTDLEDSDDNPDLERLIRNLSEDDFMHLGVAFNDNSWWSRAWVLQEVIHASEINIFCDRQSISWNIVSTVIGEGMVGREYTSRIAFTIRNAVKTFALMKYKTEYSKDLDALLSSFGDKCCTDPRDHIYAFLNLSDGSCSIQPDYTKTVSRVYLESTTALIKNSKDLRQLCSGYRAEILNVSRTDRRLDEIIPSWVSDWSSRRNSVEAGVLVQRGFNASQGRKFPDKLSHTFPPEWPWLMRLRGVMFDSVATVFPQIVTTSPVWKSEVLAWLLEIFARVEFPTSEEVFDVVWRTLLKDLSRHPVTKFVSKRLLENDRPRYRELFRHWHQQDVDHSNMGEAEFVANPLDVQNFHEFLAKSLNEHSVFITKRGYMGLTIESVKRDDRLYVVHGAPTPLLLRYEGRKFRRWWAPTEVDGWHTLVGGSYVHGIMDGEVMKMTELKNELIFLI